MKLTKLMMPPDLSCHDNALTISIDNTPLLELQINNECCRIRRVEDGSFAVEASFAGEKKGIPATVLISSRRVCGGVAVDFAAMFDLFLLCQPRSSYRLTCFSPYASDLGNRVVLKCHGEGQTLLCLFGEEQNFDDKICQLHIRPGRSSFLLAGDEGSLHEASRLLCHTGVPSRGRIPAKGPYEEFETCMMSGRPLSLNDLVAGWYDSAKRDGLPLTERLWMQLKERLLAGELDNLSPNGYEPTGDLLILLLCEYIRCTGDIPSGAGDVVTAVLHSEKRLLKGGMMPFTGDEEMLSLNGVSPDHRFFGSADNTVLFLCAAEVGLSLFRLTKSDRRSIESNAAFIRSKFVENFLPNGVICGVCASRVDLIKHPHKVRGYCDLCRRIDLLYRTNALYLCKECQDGQKAESFAVNEEKAISSQRMTEKPVIAPLLNIRYHLGLPLSNEKYDIDEPRYIEEALLRYLLTPQRQRHRLTLSQQITGAPLWLRLLSSAIDEPYHKSNT